MQNVNKSICIWATITLLVLGCESDSSSSVMPQQHKPVFSANCSRTRLYFASDSAERLNAVTIAPRRLNQYDLFVMKCRDRKMYSLPYSQELWIVSRFRHLLSRLTCVNKVCRIANHRPVDPDASTCRTLLLLYAAAKQLNHNITSTGHLRLAGTGIVFDYRWNLGWLGSYAGV